jgi:biopolymer transport protein TolR
MARIFRRPRSAQPIAELNVTNLIDLGFMLLIIFMIATPLINQNEQKESVNLPVESQSTQPKPDPEEKFATITIKADGAVSMEGRPLTLAQLARELTLLAGQPKPPVIRIRTDAKTPMQQFIAVLDEIKKHKSISKVDIPTLAAQGSR